MTRYLRENKDAISPTQFVLLLHSVPYLGEKTLTRLLRYNALHRVTPEECLAFTADTWQRQYELDPRAADHLCLHQQELLMQSAELARTVRAHKLHVLTCDSLTYPTRIERFDDSPPPILYALGSIALLDGAESARLPARFTFTTAISNGAAPAALDQQDCIAAELISAGGIPVTGHDRIPYQRLALASQRLDRPVVYVLDRGLREALGAEFDRPPFAAARIRDTVFDPIRDLALSSFRLDDHGLGANNRRRDRMLFALADIVIAIDVSAGGGMEKECKRAREQSRSVFVAPGGRAGNSRLLAVGCVPLPDRPDWTAIAANLQKPLES